MEHKEELLHAIRIFHKYAVEWDDKRDVFGIKMANYQEKYQGSYGKLFIYSKLPDEYWDLIQNTVVDELKLIEVEE